LPHGVTRQNISKDVDSLNILAHHIRARFFANSEKGKNMVGKNITEIFEQVNRRSRPASKALSSFRTDICPPDALPLDALLATNWVCS
jgi:hypothetical protein